MGRGELGDEHAVDEGHRRERGECRIEAQHHGEIEPEALEQLELEGQRGQPEVRPFRLEELARVRLEQDHPGGAPQPGRRVARHLQQRLVAAMHAIEVADGEGRTARGGGDVVRVVENLHDGDASPIEAARSRERGSDPSAGRSVFSLTDRRGV